jgi:hypothetical protein
VKSIRQTRGHWELKYAVDKAVALQEIIAAIATADDKHLVERASAGLKEIG